jgi:hypothetical protein
MVEVIERWVGDEQRDVQKTKGSDMGGEGGYLYKEHGK